MALVALVQFRANRDKETNLVRVERLCRKAAANGAQIICFPELSTTIYFCYEDDPGHFAWAEPLPGPSFDRVAAIARETQTVVVLPLYENDKGRLYNSAAVIGPDGHLIGKFRKSSIPRLARIDKRDDTTSNEQFYFLPGDLGFPVFATPFGINIGILICYDRHFPEAARVLALKGAHLLLVPTATYREWMREVWEVELRAHAIANNFYVGGINKVGIDIGGSPGRPHFGSSVFFDPRGDLIVRASRDCDEIIYADVDPVVVEDVRDLWGFFRERRPDSYGELVDTKLSPLRVAVEPGANDV